MAVYSVLALGLFPRLGYARHTGYQFWRALDLVAQKLRGRSSSLDALDTANGGQLQGGP